MPTAERDEVRVHYEEGGAGPPLLMINGLAASAYLWPRRWLEVLESRFRVVRVSNRGTGHTHAPGPFGIADLAVDALAVLDAAGFDHSHVFGYSMGGMVAQTLALEAPERVRRLVLCSTSSHGVGTTHPDFAKALGDMVSEGTTRAMAGSLFPILAADGFIDDHPEVVAELAEGWQQAPTPFATTLAQLQAAAGFDTRPRLGEIGAATLVVHGSDDRLIVHEAGPALASGIPDARFESFEGVGHLLPFETGRRGVEVVLDFLTS